MSKPPTKDTDNSLYTPQYQTGPASSQPPAGTALFMSSGLCLRGSQGVPPAAAPAVGALAAVGGRRVAVLRSNHLVGYY